MYIEHNKCTNKLTPDLIWTIRNENDVRKENNNNNRQKTERATTEHTYNYTHKDELHIRK